MYRSTLYADSDGSDTVVRRISQYRNQLARYNSERDEPAVSNDAPRAGPASHAYGLAPHGSQYSGPTDGRGYIPRRQYSSVALNASPYAQPVSPSRGRAAAGVSQYARAHRRVDEAAAAAARAGAAHARYSDHSGAGGRKERGHRAAAEREWDREWGAAPERAGRPHRRGSGVGEAGAGHSGAVAQDHSRYSGYGGRVDAGGGAGHAARPNHRARHGHAFGSPEHGSPKHGSHRHKRGHRGDRGDRRGGHSSSDASSPRRRGAGSAGRGRAEKGKHKKGREKPLVLVAVSYKEPKSHLGALYTTVAEMLVSMRGWRLKRKAIPPYDLCLGMSIGRGIPFARLASAPKRAGARRPLVNFYQSFKQLTWKVRALPSLWACRPHIRLLVMCRVLTWVRVRGVSRLLRLTWYIRSGRTANAPASTST